MGRVHRGEITVAHPVNLSVHFHCLRDKIHFFQQCAIQHSKIRIPPHHLTPSLHKMTAIALCMRATRARSSAEYPPSLTSLGQKSRHIRMPVNFLGKQCQRTQIQAVAVFQRFQIVVTERHMNDTGNANSAARGGPHPLYVMVSPLNIHGMMGHQFVQNDIRTCAAVENISYNMQFVYGKAANQFAHCRNKRIRPAIVDDGRQDPPVIEILIVIFKMRVKQFVDNIRKPLRQALADIAARIFDSSAGRHQSTDKVSGGKFI